MFFKFIFLYVDVDASIPDDVVVCTPIENDPCVNSFVVSIFFVLYHLYLFSPFLSFKFDLFSFVLC